MNFLIIGLIIFLGAHFSLRLGMVQNLKAKMGMPFKGLFSLISLIGLIMIIFGYAQYRPDAPDLYVAPNWGKHLNWLLTLVAMITALAAYLKGKITTTLKHPLLVAIKAWALGHLLANGDLASVLLFGSFLIWAIITRILMPKTTIEPLKWGRNDEAAIAFGILLWITFGYKLHALWFGVSPFGG